jgi:hypothetical protein
MLFDDIRRYHNCDMFVNGFDIKFLNDRRSHLLNKKEFNDIRQSCITREKFVSDKTFLFVQLFKYVKNKNYQNCNSALQIDI